jgi:hypothetical protein
MGNDEQDAEEFKPKGSIAFFLILMVFFVIAYFALYFEMLSRG